MKKFLYLISFLALPLFGLEYPVGPFEGLNNTDDPVTIRANQAQDLLNVKITDFGRSVKKREGFGQAFQLDVTTSVGHGAYSFYNDDGSDVQLYFNDTYAYASVSGGSLTTLFSTGTVDATYQCVDSGGFAYCVSTARGKPFFTEGSTYTDLQEASTGTTIAVSKDRLAISGTDFAPNRIDFSQAGDFTEWTLGSLATSPNQITVTAGGSRVTHLTYAFGRWVWFKNGSFGTIIEGPTLLDWVIDVIDPNIGTNDNSSLYYDGLLYFRGQDGHIYSWDGAYDVQKLTKDLEGSVNASQSRVANSWTQTTQSDFEAGVSTPSGWSDTTTNVGDLLNKSTFYAFDTAGEWNNGSYGSSNYVDTITVSGGLSMMYPDPFDTYRSNVAWTEFDLSGDPDCPSNSASGSLLTMTNLDGCATGGIRTTNVIDDFGGGTTFYFDIDSQDMVETYLVLNTSPYTGTAPWSNGTYWYLKFTNSGGNLALDTHANSASDTLTLTGSPYTVPAAIQLWLDNNSWEVTINGTSRGSGSHTWGNSTVYAYILGTASLGSQELVLDHFGVAPATMTYLSEVLDTGLSNNNHYWDEFYEYSTGTGTITYLTATSTSSDINVFGSSASVSDANAPTSTTYEYIHLLATFTVTDPTGEPLVLSSYTLGAFTYGSFDSAVNNAPNITSWDTLSVTYDADTGSHTFYMRASTTQFVSTDTTPAWSLVTANGVPTLSTGTYFQFRDDFWVDSGTAAPSLSEFIINWFEGQATDKAYVERLDDAIWWSVAVGTSQTTNNRILRYDLVNNLWTLYDVATNGMLIRNNSLYFISSSTGVVYKFGDVDNDAGSSINAYWKSKDIFFNDLFIDKDFTRISMISDSIENSSMTVTYNVDASSETSYTVYQYDSGNGVRRSNRNLTAGTLGNTLSVKFGNNASDQVFEVFGIKIDYNPREWLPE